MASSIRRISRGGGCARQNVSQHLDELIDRFDTDHDGRISRAEFVDGSTSAFDLADPIETVS